MSARLRVKDNASIPIFVRVMFSLMSQEYVGDSTTGFQSPAQDFIEPVIDLAELLDLRAPNLYPVRVLGHELAGRGILSGDILVANAAADPTSGKVCVAFLQGEVILASLHEKDGAWLLKAASGRALPLTDDTEIWAIITGLVRLKV